MNIGRNIKLAFGAIVILWMVYFANQMTIVDLRIYGIIPRHPDGLWGILAAPFLHGDMQHLIANSGVLMVLLTVSLAYSRARTYKALLIIMLLGGAMVWLLGAPGTVHIGASGIIFGLIGYLMCLGLFQRNWKALMISVVVTLLYGGALYSLLIVVPGISWSGHLFGFLSGVVAARWAK